MSEYKVNEVFVPGGMPSHTYVRRAERRLESRLKAADGACKLVTVTGATKSGKTVLARTVFPRNSTLWIDGGAVAKEDDFWTSILDMAGGHTNLSSDRNQGKTSAAGGFFEGEAGLPLFVKAKGQVSGQIGTTEGETVGKGLTLTPRAAAISRLLQVKLPLVIDDFHYIDRALQGSIIRALKPLVFDGISVVLIAIPHRRYDAVRVEREMTGRLEAIEIPVWDQAELLRIANTGFPLLNIEIAAQACERLAREAIGSPHLMQEFCKQLTLFYRESDTEAPIAETDIQNVLFESVAEGTGKIVFDKLARGPRQRSDRIQRRLKSGKTGDIYRVVLLALADLQMGLDTIGYEELRASIRKILEDDIPQAHEVTRVLEKMSEIAASDEASTPVLDWEKDQQQLHITDPFFAFYLKWGVNDN